MPRATQMWTSTLIFMANEIYFGQRRDKQTARETIICRLAAGNFEDETVSVQNRELKQPRRQRHGKRHFKNDFQIFQTFSR